MTLVEVQARLLKRSTPVGVGTVHRFFARHRAHLCAPSHHAQKKTGHAIEPDRPDILQQRQEWFDGKIDFEAERFVFIDKTFTATNMSRSQGRCPKGERLRRPSFTVTARPPLWSWAYA